MSSTIPTQLPMISSTPQGTLQHQPATLQLSRVSKPYIAPNLTASQNYIPQSEGRPASQEDGSDVSKTGKSAPPTSTATNNNNAILNNLLNQHGSIACPPLVATSTVNGDNATSIPVQQHQLLLPAEIQHSNGKFNKFNKLSYK